MAENENEIPGILELVRVARKTGSELLIRQYRSSTGSTKDYQVQLLGPSGYGDLLLETEQYLRDIIAGGNSNIQLLTPTAVNVGSMSDRIKYDEAVAFAKQWLKELEDRRLIPGTTGASNSFIPEAPGECNLYRNAKGELMLRNLRNMQAIPAPTPEELAAMTGKQLVQRYAPTTTYGQMFRMLTTHCEAVQMCMEVEPPVQHITQVATVKLAEDIPEWIVEALPSYKLVDSQLQPGDLWKAFISLALRTAPISNSLLADWTGLEGHSFIIPDPAQGKKWDGVCNLMHGLIGMMSEMGEVARCVTVEEREEELADVLWYTAIACHGAALLWESVDPDDLAHLKSPLEDIEKCKATDVGDSWDEMAYSAVDTGKRILCYRRRDLLPLLLVQLHVMLNRMEFAMGVLDLAPPHVICRRVIHKLAKRYPAGFSVEAARQRADKDEATDDVQR